MRILRLEMEKARGERALRALPHKRFYEKVIKVKADVAALPICFPTLA